LRRFLSRASTALIVLLPIAACRNASTPAAAQAPQQAAATPVAAPASPAPSGFDTTVASAPITFKPTTLGRGTHIPVKLLSVADSSVTQPGFLPGTVISDVKGGDGSVVIPADSPVVVMIRDSSKTGPISRMVFGLYSVRIGNREHELTDGAKEPAVLTFTEDAGRGPAHSAVHLQFGATLDFQLQNPLPLR
jgi:hypothetical protein